jgi:hypothetical protein
VDQEVAKTLGELELQLQELELTTIGRGNTPAESLHAPGKLIDEAMERKNDDVGEIPAEPSAEEQDLADGDGFGGPAVFGGEEVPAQPGATIERDWTVETRETAYGEIPTPPSPSTPPSPPLPPSQPPAPTPQPPPSTPPGMRPASPSQDSPLQPSQRPDPRRPAAVEENQSIDLAELVRFRDKLARTMGELIDEYSRLLSQKPPSR